MTSSCILLPMVGCPQAAPKRFSVNSEACFSNRVAIDQHSHLARIHSGKLRRDRLPRRNVSAPAFGVTGPGSIDSPMMTAMQEKVRPSRPINHLDHM